MVDKNVLHLSDTDFDQTVKEKSPIIVDFWASWCGPCMMMGPVFEELSKDYEGVLNFAKLSTEENPESAHKARIQSIPCLVLYKDGKEEDRIIGAMPKEVLKEKIDAILHNEK
jgi:thioredoxin 1